MSKHNALVDAVRMGQEIDALLTQYPPPGMTEERQRDLSECLNILRKFNRRIAHIEYMHERDQEKVNS